METRKGRRVELPKITRPEAAEPLLRPRLFQWLEQSPARICWISGPPGAGKTTLASSFLVQAKRPHLWYQMDDGDADPATFFHYLALAADRHGMRRQSPLPKLTPEYLPGLGRFTGRFAELMSARLKTPVFLVLDNYEQVPADAPLHGIVRDLAGRLANGFRVIVLSRTAPPPLFAQMRLYGDLTILESESLNLELDEARDLAKVRCLPDAQSPTDDARIARLHALTHGWIAGFKLLLADANLPAPEFNGANASQSLLFDFFAAELFNRFSEDVRRALASTALLPAMTAAQAETLTGNPVIGSVLADLQAQNCFVSRRPDGDTVYEYHALFRAFLLDRAKANSPAGEWRALQSRAAEIIAAGEQVDKAVDLWRSAEDWTGVAAMAARESPAMIAAGRHSTLREWLEGIPDAVLDEAPWLWYWRGMALAPFNPAEARGFFEHAFRCFELTDEADGLYSAWAGLMETFLYEWRDFKPVDPWIEVYERLRERHPEFSSTLVELRTLCAFVSVMFRCPQHPLVKAWARRGEKVIDPDANPDFSILLGSYIVGYCSWRGDVDRIQGLVNRLDRYTGSPAVQPMSYIVWRVAGGGFFRALSGDIEGFSTSKKQVLDKAKQTGLHLWDYQISIIAVGTALVAGNLAVAQRDLEVAKVYMDRDPWSDRTVFHYFSGNFELERQNWRAAEKQLRQTVALAQTMGMPYPEAGGRIYLARALFRLELRDEAENHLRIAREIGRQIESTALEYLCLITEADNLLRHDQNDMFGLAALDKALRLSRRMHGPLTDFSTHLIIIPIYIRALNAGLEADHVRAMIQRFNYLPPDPDSTPDNWPWPIRIQTLGHFEVFLDDEPLKFSGRYPRKPMELLKYLCAFGGDAVDEQRLNDALWPEADGDAADQALRTNLHRLRKLLGRDDAIHFERRQLSLNPRLVWIDSRSFLRVAQRHDETGIEVLRQVFNRYQGHFMAGESAPWVLSHRENLRAHFLRLAERLGNLLEQSGEVESAIDCYLRTVDLEPTAEHIYRRLMQAHVQLGQPAMAVAVYQRCRLALHTHLRRLPSRETDALRLSLTGH